MYVFSEQSVVCPKKGAARRSDDSGGSTKSGSGGAAVIGSWTGNDGQQKISVKFGANGSLIITNAAGANPGQWTAAGGGRFQIHVGSFNGVFVMVNSSTASLTLGDSSVELRR